MLTIKTYCTISMTFTTRCYAARPMPSCGVCLSVSPSVHPSVTFVYSVEKNKNIFNFSSLSGSHTILVFRVRRYGNIPTRTPLTEASTAVGLGKNCDCQPIYRSVAFCERFGRQVKYTLLRRTVAS